MPGRSLYRVDIAPRVADVIRHLPPDVKQGIKSAFRALTVDPNRGEPLRRELAGLWKYRVRRFRIVYSIERRHRAIRIVAVGHRREIYDEVSSLIRRLRSPRDAEHTDT